MTPVICPHCQLTALAEVPTEAILFTQCPQCNNVIAVYLGQMLPALDQQVMGRGNVEEICEELLPKLMIILRDRLIDLLSGNMERISGMAPEPEITEEEVEQFKGELDLLDDPNWFKARFG